MDRALHEFVHSQIKRLNRRRVQRALADIGTYTAYEIYIPDREMCTAAREIGISLPWYEVVPRLPVRYEQAGITAMFYLHGNSLRLVVFACEGGCCI